jgi:hypothetical protein
LIIVRRDRPEVMRAILDSRARWPAGTAIMFDRRYTDRRRRRFPVPEAGERRVCQRRVALELAALAQGYLVAEVATIPPQAAILQPRDTSPNFGMRHPPSIQGGRTGSRPPTPPS